MGIKKFIVKMIIFILISFPVLTFKNFLYYYTGMYQSSVYGSEIYRSLQKSKMKKKVKKLLIGDSVGNQLYNNNTYNDSIFSLTCNQAISMVGQYVLLANFIDSNQRNLPEEVILLITPDSFLNNLNQDLSYHYFLKPFYHKENEKYFDELCKAQIKKIPYYYTSTIPFIKSSNWSPEYVPEKDTTYKIISPISSDYIIKIKYLCLRNNIKFNITPTPVKSSNYQTIAKYSKDQKEIYNNANLGNDLNSYFSNITPMPDSLFRDHNHFKNKYIPSDYLKLKG